MWTLLGLLGAILILAIPFGAIAGFLAFRRTGRLASDLAELRAEVVGLRAALGARASLAARATAPADAGAEAIPDPAPDVATQPQDGRAPVVAIDLAPASPDEPAAATPEGPAPSPPPLVRTEVPDAAPAPRASQTDPGARIERSLAGNWLVLVGGIALALGGLFIVQAAAEAGWFGPLARILLAVAAGAGMILGGEWLRRRPSAVPAAVGSAAPALATGAGLVTLYGAVFAAHALYALIPALAAFGLLALVAFGAAALALRQGPILVALALGGGFLAPVLIRTETADAAALFGHVFAVAAVGLAVTARVGHRWPGLLALLGGALWAMLWLASPYGGGNGVALSVFLPGLLALALAFAMWEAGRESPTTVADALSGRAPALLAAHVSALVALGLVVLLAARTGHAPAPVVAMGALAALLLVAGVVRPGFAYLPALGPLGAAALLLDWPEARAVALDEATRISRYLGDPAAAPEGLPFVGAAIAFAALFGLGGFLLQRRTDLRGPLAATLALGLNLMLAVAFWRLAGPDGGFLWSLAAVALAGLMLALLETTREKPGGLDARPGVASAYAAGLAGALGLLVGFTLDQLWMSAGFAAQALILALLHRRFRAPALPWAAAGFALLATVRLTILPEAFPIDVGPWPILNALLPAYGLAALALAVAAGVLRRDGIEPRGRVIQGLEAGALLVTVAHVSLQLRHALNGGDLSAPYVDNLVEVGLQTTAWIAGAAALRWRLGPDLAFAPRWTERLLLLGALLHLMIVQGVLANPWFGAAFGSLLGGGGEVAGVPILNSLFAGYAAPGFAAALWAMIARPQGLRRRAAAAGLLGAWLLFAWANLEVAFLFRGPDLAAGAASDAETYAYSIVWVIFATLTLALGVLRRRPSLRFAALGLLAAATVKVFLFDLGNLEGLWRGLSFLGLGAGLLAVGVLYQRVIAPLAARERGEAAAPNAAARVDGAGGAA